MDYHHPSQSGVSESLFLVFQSHSVYKVPLYDLDTSQISLLMNFRTIIILLSTLFLTAFSQTITIISPPPGAEITAGQDVTVQLGFGDTLTGVQHVSVVIATFNCAAIDGCPVLDASSPTLGDPLFKGNYTPEFHEGNLPPYENYTVSIPATLTAGTNMLTVAHFMLIGAGATPILQFANVTVSTLSPTSTAPTMERRMAIRGRMV